MNPIAVLTTVATLDDARRIANALVARRLVACAQISAIESIYTWDGAEQNEQEFRLLLKTTDERYESVERAIRDMHPYELPAIHALRFEHVFAPYAAWIESNADGQ